MADGLQIREHVECSLCLAREQAVPVDAQLRALTQEDWVAEIGAFVPRAMNQDQAVASELLTMALERFVEVYGIDIAAPRVASMLSYLRVEAKRMKIDSRIRAAREPIYRRARVAWDRGDTNAMRQIEAEPTPDYPGKAQDDAWLKEDAEVRP